MYIICQFFFLKPLNQVSRSFLFVHVTNTSAKISNTFSYRVVVTNQLCSVHLLYLRLTGPAFMYKLRPLNDNPIEHAGLQHATWWSPLNAVSIFVFSCVSLLFPFCLSEGYQSSQWQIRADSNYTDTRSAFKCDISRSRLNNHDKRCRRAQSSLPLARVHHLWPY